MEERHFPINDLPESALRHCASGAKDIVIMDFSETPQGMDTWPCATLEVGVTMKYRPLTPADTIRILIILGGRQEKSQGRDLEGETS